MEQIKTIVDPVLIVSDQRNISVRLCPTSIERIDINWSVLVDYMRVRLFTWVK